MSGVVEAVKLYSVAAAASLLEVSTDYIYDRIKTGELGVVELGTGRAKQRLRADVLQSFIDAHTFGAPISHPVGSSPSTG